MKYSGNDDTVPNLEYVWSDGQSAAPASRPGHPHRFTINLLTAHEPNRIPASHTRQATSGAVNFQHLHFYQIAVTEAGRARYRLRLGDFGSELECDAVLSVVRKRYPDAFRVLADEMDRDAIAAAARLQGMQRAPGSTGRLGRPIDSTRTTRHLSPDEANDADAVKWFSIRLLDAEQVVRPDEVPALDIFEVYCLYSVTAYLDERATHSLRLGFFSEPAAAEAVTQYLRDYFKHAQVLRVSAEERARFTERQIKAQKDVGATGCHEVIEMGTAQTG